MEPANAQVNGNPLDSHACLFLIIWKKELFMYLAAPPAYGISQFPNQGSNLCPLQCPCLLKVGDKPQALPFHSLIQPQAWCWLLPRAPQGVSDLRMQLVPPKPPQTTPGVPPPHHVQRQTRCLLPKPVLPLRSHLSEHHPWQIPPSLYSCISICSHLLRFHFKNSLCSIWLASRGTSPNQPAHLSPWLVSSQFLLYLTHSLR